MPSGAGLGDLILYEYRNDAVEREGASMLGDRLKQ